PFHRNRPDSRLDSPGFHQVYSTLDHGGSITLLCRSVHNTKYHDRQHFQSVTPPFPINEEGTKDHLGNQTLTTWFYFWVSFQAIQSRTRNGEALPQRSTKTTRPPFGCCNRTACSLRGVFFGRHHGAIR